MMIDVALLEASIACQMQDVVKFSRWMYMTRKPTLILRSLQRAQESILLWLWRSSMFVYLIIILSTIDTPLLLSSGQSAQI